LRIFRPRNQKTQLNRQGKPNPIRGALKTFVKWPAWASRRNLGLFCWGPPAPPRSEFRQGKHFEGRFPVYFGRGTAGGRRIPPELQRPAGPGNSKRSEKRTRGPKLKAGGGEPRPPTFHPTEKTLCRGPWKEVPRPSSFVTPWARTPKSMSNKRPRTSPRPLGEGGPSERGPWGQGVLNERVGTFRWV